MLDPTQYTWYDTDGNGAVDSGFTDSNGDGYVDALAGDLNQDGVVDYVAQDTNLNGVIDTVRTDPNGTGAFDLVGQDLDENGVVEQFIRPSGEIVINGTGLVPPSTYAGGVPSDPLGFLPDWVYLHPYFGDAINNISAISTIGDLIRAMG
ncbi:hypothetical protein [Naasia sp. SYSU D00057]|uniref:hypothetical protein n=1 Tax=Naasia sp. SYSU D00057 TaxID=2817380 RepID=UPI001B302242|nr:hypothetical protein [Naasia sp. SYSU D00057]